MSTEKLINYITFVILILIIGSQTYNLVQTRHDSFPGVWIVRCSIVLLIILFLNSFVFSAFIHRFTMDQVPPCASVAYFRFRWYTFLLAGAGLAAIPVYLAILHRTNLNRLLILLASQIQVNLFTVLLSIGMDALSRFMHNKSKQSQQAQQSQAQAQAQSQQAPQSPANPQFGYFSPKNKGPPPLASQKNPFDSNKYRYARWRIFYSITNKSKLFLLVNWLSMSTCSMKLESDE